jgi:hypothetical protein
MAYSQADVDVHMNDSEGEPAPPQQSDQTLVPSNSNNADGQLPTINSDTSMDLSGIGVSLNEATSLVGREYDSEASVEPQNSNFDLQELQAKAQGTPLRVNSLVLASFPWYTSLPMVPTRIAQRLGEKHYGAVS